MDFVLDEDDESGSDFEEDEWDDWIVNTFGTSSC